MSKSILSMAVAVALLVTAGPAFAQRNGGGGGGGAGGPGGSSGDGASGDVYSWTGAFIVNPSAGGNPKTPGLPVRTARGRKSGPAPGLQSCQTHQQSARNRIGNTKEMTCRES